MNKRIKSGELFARACKVIPKGVNSPVRAFGNVGGTPVFVERGKGAYIFDADGNRYVDYCQSWGASILGHAHPKVVEAISIQAARGTSFGIPTELEVKLADFILEKFGRAEMIRFVSSGTEAVMSAVRLARGYTGKKGIIKFEGGYHGHVDHLLAQAGSGLATLGLPASAGVTEDNAKHTYTVPFGELDKVEDLFSAHDNDIACVLIEGIPANNGLLIQGRNFMHALQNICRRCKALFVVDEVITGFRVGPDGACGLYDLDPDLVTFGKIIGGGLPVGAFAGRREIMERIAPLGPVYQAGTLSGNPLAMASGLAVLHELFENNCYAKLDELGKYFEDGIRALIEKNNYPLNIARAGSIFWLSFAEGELPTQASQISKDSIQTYARFFHACLEQGFYFAPSGYEVGFITTAHSLEILDQTLIAIESSLKEIF